MSCRYRFIVIILSSGIVFAILIGHIGIDFLLSRAGIVLVIALHIEHSDKITIARVFSQNLFLCPRPNQVSSDCFYNFLPDFSILEPVSHYASSFTA